MALAACRERNHVPRVHVYLDHVFIVVHAPEIGTAAHVHYLELDQFIAERFLVTVPSPLNPVVPLTAALRETQSVAERMATGHLNPASPFAPVVGMNVIVSDRTQWALLIVLLTTMLIMSGILLRWTKRQGWW